jgi:hypothetical protein
LAKCTSLARSSRMRTDRGDLTASSKAFFNTSMAPVSGLPIIAKKSISLTKGNSKRRARYVASAVFPVPAAPASRLASYSISKNMLLILDSNINSKKG